MRRIFILLPLLLFIACSTDLDVMVPSFGDNSIIEETNPLSPSAKQKMEGVYQVIDGSDQFGSQVVLKWNGEHLSVFGEKEAPSDETALFATHITFVNLDENGNKMPIK